MKKLILRYLPAFACLAAVMLYSCSDEETTQAVVDPYNGHEYVDLGLSVMWATCNIGAEKPQDYGDYFAWGETETKDYFSWDNYKFTTDGGNTFAKYTGSDFSELCREDDAASVNWGGSWHTPTLEEFIELGNNTDGVWIEQGDPEFGGVAGAKITSNKPGYTDKYIFIPAAGCRFLSELYGAGVACYNWTATLYNADVHRVYRNVLRYSPDIETRSDGRAGGHTIRPVCPSGRSTDEDITPDEDDDDTTPAPTSHNGYECIDFGIRIDGKKRLFATCNVGASHEYDYGDFFAWGATAPYYTGYTMSGTSVTVTSWKDGMSGGYAEPNAPFYSSGSGSTAVYTTYTAAGAVLSPEHDAARANMGGEWRMPTIEEIQALCDKTTSVWTNDYKGSGIAGCIITGKGKYADRTMFLPAAGIFSGTSHSQAAHQGYYWSSTLHNGSNGKFLGSVFGGSMGARGYDLRYFGFPVRAVFTVAE